MTQTHGAASGPEAEPLAGRRALLAERLAAGGTRICPVSAAQRRLWFEDQLRPGRTDYTVVWPLRLIGPLDVPALRAALTALVARHEVLRTRFVGVDGEPVQVVDPPAPFDCPLTEPPPAAREDEPSACVRERIVAAGARPFDLASGPLFTAELLREDAGRHVLLLTAHHIVFDGWSWSVLLGDLSALYEDLRAGGEGDVLKPLPVQYGDYAAWERESLSGETLTGHLDFWRTHLDGAPVAADLPTDHDPGPAGRSGAGARRTVSVPPGPAGRLDALCAEEGATTFMGVLAATGVVLGRYGGVEDVVVGTLAANRSQPELDDLIGFFVNPLPLRVDLSGTPTFRELLARCRATALGAFAHQDLPFDRLVEELAPRRTPGATPYTRVALVMHNGPEEPAALGGLAAESLRTETRTATFDLSLQLRPGDDGGLDGFVEYATDLFTPRTALRFAGHVTAVLERMTAEPDRPVGEFALLTEEERVAALAAARPAPTSEERGRDTREGAPGCLHALVSAQAARIPEAVAVRCGEQTLTYAELDRAAAAVAARLRAEGVGPEDLVGVCVRRSLWSVAALLGVLRTGAAYLPLEPDNPADRLAYVIADSGARTVLVETDLRQGLPAGGFRTVLLEEALRAPADPDAAPAEVTPDHLAYVIYTSGSTGLPKGVAVTHRAAVTRVHGPRFVTLTEQDVMLHALALSFDVSVLEVFGALTNGCQLAVLPGKALPERVGAFLSEHGVTVGWLTAALFHAVVDTAGEGLAGMRTLIAGGDQLSADHVERALGLLGPNALLVNGYGPTEATVFASTHPMRPGGHTPGRVPIGAPIPDTELFVMDAAFQPAPVGVPGELYIGGDCLARGYLGRPGLTAERFLPHPCGAPGARLYRTGDLVRRRSDGLLEFLGRTDHQVKVRGFRVELGEIEQVLRRHPDVGEAVVVARADARAEHTLVAHVEPVPGAAPHSAELLEHCRGLLPGYMVPAVLVVLEALPLNPNGKVDRAALPATDGARPELRTGYVPPRGPIEEAVAGIWREVLGLDRVGAHDDFFDLGGHSLLASRLLSRVRRTFARDLPLAVFFAGPTVAALAADLEARLTDGAVTTRAAPGAVPRPDPLPASPGQRRLWFAHQLDPESVDYTIVWPLRMSGALDTAALRRALDGVTDRHEALRTRFAHVEGEPVQVVDPPEGLDCPLTDLRGLPRGERAAAVGERITAAGTHRFDLAADRLLRAELLRVSEEEHVLVLCVHHIVFDGWSSSVLLRDLAALYEDAAEDRAEDAAGDGAEGAGTGGDGLPPLAVQYGDYAVWERDWLSGPALEGQLAHWRAQLAGAPETTPLPVDLVPAESGRTGAGARHEVTVPGATGAALSAFCARTGATPFMGLLAALGVVLGRYGDTDDVVVGTYAANRGRPELEDLVGFFVNTLPLRLDLSGDPDFRELVTRCRTAALGAFAHQDVPFDRLVEELAPRRGAAGTTPYVRVALVMQNVPDEEVSLGGVRVESLPSETTSATFDLALHLWPDARPRTGEGEVGGLDGFVEYATDLFTRPTAARFVGHVRRVLEQGLADPDRPVREHTLLTGPEAHALATGADGGVAHFGDEGIATRFLRQAARTPAATAFLADGATLSYAELAAASAALAARLRARGVGPEAPVGVCLPRGLPLPVAALGIWRAGGAYLPLDPQSPPARIARLTADSGARLVVTDTAHEHLVPSAVPRIVLDGVPDAHVTDADPPDDPPHEDDARVEGGIDALAAVIYTSGSTGLPKGVALTARSVLNRIDWMASAWPRHPDDVACQKGPTGFVDGLWELLGGLLHGVPTVVAPPETGTDPRALVALLAEHRVTKLLVVPSLLHALLDVPDLAERLPHLTHWVSSGEELPPRLARLFGERMPGRELRNLYGSSEAWDALCQRGTDLPARGGPVPVGVPLSNVRAHVLDRELRPVPVGVTGDLHLAGACLARGYLGRPDLTAERFVPDPSGTGGRLYRSGDRAVRRADGRIELAGRADLQLKVRGVRVEPAEVERALEHLPGVREAAVVGWRRPGTGGDGGLELAAHLVPEPGAVLDERALRAELARTLPGHLVPAVLSVLDALPLNSSGKVDRAALPEPRPPAARTGASSGGTGATRRERELAALWAGLLGVDTVGPHEDFFDLGGHSLLAMRLVDGVAESFGVRWGVRTVFEHPTVHLQSRLLPAPEGPPVPDEGPPGLAPSGEIPPGDGDPPREP